MALFTGSEGMLRQYCRRVTVKLLPERPAVAKVWNGEL